MNQNKRRNAKWSWGIRLAVFVIILGFGYSQLPPAQWNEAKVGNPLSHELLISTLQEPAKGKWFSSQMFWGRWYMNLSIQDGVVIKKEIFMRIGTAKHRVDLKVSRIKTTEPNHALEPTTFAVTSRAPSSTSRASEGRGSS